MAKNQDGVKSRLGSMLCFTVYSTAHAFTRAYKPLLDALGLTYPQYLAMFALWENNPWNPGTRYIMSRVPFDRDAIVITPFEARRLLRDAGFEIISTDYLFVFPHLLRALRPLERLLTPFPLGGQYLVLARKR